MTAFKTADLCDEYVGNIRIAEPIFRSFGKKHDFCGPVHTIKTFEDNSLVRAALERPGTGHVLVVDGAGSRRCALVGGNLAALAVQNDWAGLVIFGCIRDAAEIDTLDIGIRALATYPLKSFKNGYGNENVPVSFAGITFRPGHYLYADSDGMILAPEKLQ